MTAIEILENLIIRLNNFFTIQTQEVIPELNKIKELLTTETQEVKIEDKTQEPPKDNNEQAEKAMEYLKSIKAKGIYNYKDNEKLIERAVKEWFIIS